MAKRHGNSGLSGKVLICAVALGLGAPSSSWAQARSAWAEGGVGFAAVLTSIVYSTVKCLYAGAGAVTGLTAFVLTGGRKDVLDTIVNPALRGDYVITPEHLRRERSLVFIGPYPEDLTDEPSAETAPPTQGEPSEAQRGQQPYPF